MSVLLQGNTLPSIKIYDLDQTVAWGQIVEIANLQYSQSTNTQELVSRGLLILLPGSSGTPTTVNMSDVDPDTFNLRPQSVEMEDCEPIIQAILMNEVAEVMNTFNISDISSGGDIGTAATTVDINPSFNIHQTTAGQTITLPAPTSATAGRIVYINNVGSVSFSILGKSLPTGAGLTAMWTGSAWSLIGFGG
jgi:hypothetical protein